VAKNTGARHLKHPVLRTHKVLLVALPEEGLVGLKSLALSDSWCILSAAPGLPLLTGYETRELTGCFSEAHRPLAILAAAERIET